MTIYNKQIYAGMLLIAVFIVIGCTMTETISTPPTTMEIPGTTEIPYDTMTPIPTLPTVMQSLMPSPTAPSATQTTVESTNTPVMASTVTPTLTPNMAVEVTPYSTDIGVLEPVPASDPRWSAIIQRVNELQGFYTLALSPDGKFLAAIDSYDEYSKVYLWNVETGDTEWILELDQPLATSELVFSPDGTQLAVGTSSVVQDIFVWDVTDGSQLHHFTYRESTIDVKFSPDSKRLAVSGNIPGAVTVWNLEDESMIELGRGSALDFMPLPSTSTIVVAMGQRSPSDLSPVYLLDLQNGQEENLFPGEYFAGNIAISPDGQYLATFIANEEGQGSLRVLNLQADVELQLEGNEPDTILGTQQIGFSTKGHLAVLHRDLTVWNIEGELLGLLYGRNIKGFMFTPDGSYLLTYGLIRTPLEVWELPPS